MGKLSVCNVDASSVDTAAGGQYNVDQTTETYFAILQLGLKCEPIFVMKAYRRMCIDCIFYSKRKFNACHVSNRVDRFAEYDEQPEANRDNVTG